MKPHPQQQEILQWAAEWSRYSAVLFYHTKKAKESDIRVDFNEGERWELSEDICGWGQNLAEREAVGSKRKEDQVGEREGEGEREREDRELSYISSGNCGYTMCLSCNDVMPYTSYQARVPGPTWALMPPEFPRNLSL